MKQFFSLFITLLAFESAYATQTTVIGIDGNDWTVTVDLTGYKIMQNLMKPDGRRYFLAGKQTKPTGFTVSVTLEKSNDADDRCDQSLKHLEKNNGSNATKAKYSKRNDFETIEYMIEKDNGKVVNDKFIRGCKLYRNTYVDINVSKVYFSDSDSQELYRLIDSVKFVVNQQTLTSASSMDLFMQGTELYNSQRFSDAIPFYEQALEKEKIEQKLEQKWWYVLIDNLSMAYGILKQYDKTKEVIQYGISRKPNYPLFYYNLACMYAEQNDKKQAIENLKLAFKHKKNVIEGERIPDPKTDDSFKELMKYPEFQSFVQTLK